MIHTRSPQDFRDYELIDSGHFEKIERFGSQVLIRPEPQAVWESAIPRHDWDKLANTVFTLEEGQNERGSWKHLRNGRDRWTIHCEIAKSATITFHLQLTAFKHVGIFPEQSCNWDYIHASCLQRSRPRVLNMFAYTGGASLAAASAGAEVTHLDAVKKVVSWSRENMESSGLKDIRWMVEDAFSFAKRESRRGNLYDGLILDPPAYGRGPEGEKWVMESMIDEFLSSCSSILRPDGFLVLNLYSMGFSALIAENLISNRFDRRSEIGELFVPDQAGRKLPLGIYARFDGLAAAD